MKRYTIYLYTANYNNLVELYKDDLEENLFIEIF